MKLLGFAIALPQCSSKIVFRSAPTDPVGCRCDEYKPKDSQGLSLSTFRVLRKVPHDDTDYNFELHKSLVEELAVLPGSFESISHPRTGERHFFR